MTVEANPRARAGFRAMGGLFGVCLLVASVGLWLLLGEIAPQAGLIAFYTGAPVSAVFGVIGGGLVVAWPLDITVIMVVGYVLGGATTLRDRPWWQGTVLGVIIFLVAALLWSLLVTADPDWVQIWTSRES